MESAAPVPGGGWAATRSATAREGQQQQPAEAALDGQPVGSIARSTVAGASNAWSSYDPAPPAMMALANRSRQTRSSPQVMATRPSVTVNTLSVRWPVWPLNG